MSELRRVVVTGMGIVSPVGNWPGPLFDNVAEGRSGIRLLPAGERASPVQLAAWIDTPIDDASKGAPPDRVTQLALAAGRYALTEAGLLERPELLADMGVHLGTGSGASTTTDEAFYRLYGENRNRLAPMTLPRGINNAAASELAIRFGLSGVNNTYSIACASSSSAIGEALRAIRHGYSERILAGGSEALLTYGILHAWHALRALATPDAQVEASCRPFSADRNGLVLGEGAAFLVLESLASAQARGATILAELAGYGASCDAAHITHPSSSGQVKAIRHALTDAGLDPGAIDYVNAHGTGTPAGDAVEAESLRTVFSEHLHTLPVSSSKAVHGHLMGAGGAVELAIAIIAMQKNVIPPTAHCRVTDPGLGIDVVAEGMRQKTLSAVLSNSFAFGGSNAVLIARRCEE
ncbi:3-oxoacyl-ACP synthase II [Sulfuriferula plumbiphila]|uniref:Nodulation protein E n=1 Tax=Sulfuriferula plumbiphila TaxID=171865 RepID=A0A512L8X0_9PROT|nr:beta-ketoacyl-[acyl-carrier-protein] synthase family protein [Sulfuriferula plumbiphila]BBP04251.1 3-oxoacyl-ACP synthase II [Sulfuriferula plumbiphila]GEP30919.1 3-oxoacyl-ACP synthase II [Sulfuriferula plumbiphila]